MNDYTIGNGTLKNIANAIRAQEGSSENMRVDDFASRITAFNLGDEPVTGDISNQNTSYYGISSNTISAIGNAIKIWDNLSGPVSGFAQRILNLYIEQWVRPSDWPNYDYVTRDDNVIYFTIKQDANATKTFSIGNDTSSGTENIRRRSRVHSQAIPKADSNANYTSTITTSTAEVRLEKGYIDEEGFHVESSYTGDNIITEKTIPIGENYEVWRLITDSNHPFFAITKIGTASVLEVWGNAPYIWWLDVIDQYTESFDILCGSDLYPDQSLRWSPFCPRADYDDSSHYGLLTNYHLKHINLDGINWEVICRTGTSYQFNQTFPGTQETNIIYSLDFSFLANKEIRIYSSTFPFNHFNPVKAFCNTFAKGNYKQITFPIVKFIVPGTTSSDSYYTSLGFYDTFKDTKIANILDLSQVTIEFINTPTYYYMVGVFDNINTNTIYCPNIIVPESQENKISYSVCFRVGDNVQEIYNAPDIMYKGTSTLDIGGHGLSRNTILRFFNAISPADKFEDNTYINTIRIYKTVADKLTEADIAILTNKGHTLSVSNN